MVYTGSQPPVNDLRRGFFPLLFADLFYFAREETDIAN